MKPALALVYILILSILVCSEAQGEPTVYPLRISENRRYLVDQKGEPFFWSGEAAWSLIAQLNKEDAVFYLENRRLKGFNVVMVNLLEHKFSSNPPENYYGEKPFGDRSFTAPNEKYFAHADYVIEQAGKRGIMVLLFPLYLGWRCGDQGWCEEVRNASLREMRSWGRYVGNRYMGFHNIVWCIGGDTDPSEVRSKVMECVKGIRETDPYRLITAHNQPETFSSTPWVKEPWLDIESVYSYSTTLYTMCEKAYNKVPTRPYFIMESAYENEHNASDQRLRAQAFWSVLYGGMGHIWGNCPIWHFGGSPDYCGLSNWKRELDSAGSNSMQHLQTLFTSIAWHLLEPDSNHRVLVSGYGKWGQEDYSTAAITSDRSTLIAYLPSAREVTIDMSKISGREANCWWFVPAKGSFVLIGKYETRGMKKLIPPTKGDWVLVIKKAGQNSVPPGRNQQHRSSKKN